jgi:putative DNA primase/helicase
MAQHKFCHQFEFVNFAKLIYACNNPPEIKDRSDAMWNRMIHLTFPNKFLDNSPGTDPDILLKLTTDAELSGLFNWAMIGLTRLKRNSRFSYNKTTEENMAAYDRKAEPVLAYAQDTLIEAGDSYILKNELYKSYVDWCKKEKQRVLNEVWFSRKLKDVMPGCYPFRLQTVEPRQRVFMGIAFKDGTNNNVVYGSSQSSELTSIEPQQKLNIEPSLEDKINSLFTCLEMMKDMTIEMLKEEGFTETFLNKCLEKGIIHIKPDGTVGV